MAELAARGRRYSQAAGYASRAVEMDSLSWRGYGLLGMNQLRIGQIEEGKRNLEISFEGDPYNPWNKNTLDLVDTFANYRTIQSGNFEIVVEEPEADILSLYLPDLAENAYEVLGGRYSFPSYLMREN